MPNGSATISRVKAVLIGVAVIILIGIGAVFLMRDVPAPASAPNPRSAAPAPTPGRVKKATPPSAARGAAPPRKAVPKKAAAPVAAAPAAPKLAMLTIASDVPGASVFIDRQFVGNTPLSLDNLEPGTRRLQLTATGFDSVQKSIDLVPGPNAITVRIKEVSLSTKIPVVHKHGMGSCEGTLIATLYGLTYETSHRSDGFTLPYTQAEQFDVEYLQKNLRLKQKGGKTWNFTDKNATADALFVFHRDVEAARKKLADGYTPIR
jgi:PEGA domain-containing protein